MGHNDFYHTVKREALRSLATVVDEDDAETCREVDEQMRIAFEEGDGDEFIRALKAYIFFCHSHLELKEHAHEGGAVQMGK
jgi:DNA-binding GntR family transcriptional regulator